MAEPITWRTINAPEPKDALMPMVYGGRTLNEGFAALQKTLGMVTDNDEANWQNQKANNTRLLQDELRLAKTPEQVAALEASGRMAEMRAAMGSQFDAAVINPLEDNRMGLVRDNLTKAQQFAEAQQMEAEKPLAREFEMARLKGDNYTMERIAQENPNALFLPKQLDAFRSQMQQDYRFERERIKGGQEDQLFPGQLTLQNEQILNQPAARKVAQQNADTSAQQVSNGELSATASILNALIPNGSGSGGRGGSGGGSGSKGSSSSENKAYDLKQEEGGLSDGTLDNSKGIHNAMKAFKELGVSKPAQDNIFENIRKHYPKGIAVGEDEKGNPIYEPITVSALVEAVSQAPDDRAVVRFFGGSVQGDNTRILLDKNYAYRLPNGEINTDQKREKVDALRVAREARDLRMNPQPSASSTAAVNPMDAIRQNLLNTLIANNPTLNGSAQKKTR